MEPRPPVEPDKETGGRAPAFRRLYELAMRSFPRTFRERFGDEIRAAVEGREAEAARRSPPHRAWSRVSTLLDLLGSGALERGAAWRTSRRRESVTGVGPARGRGDVMEGWMDGMRAATRGLARSPLFSVQAVLTVALGTLGLTAVYPVLHQVVLRLLPYREPDRLVAVRTALEEQLMGVTAPELRLLGRAEGLFQGVAALVPPQYDRSFTWTDPTPPERLDAVQVTPEFFRVLGVETGGPGFDPSFGGPGQVILSHGFWQRRFGGDPDVVGRALSLNDAPYTVVGILPADFEFPLTAQPFDVWIVLRIDPAMPASNDNRVFRMVARLADGASLDQAAARVPGMIRDFHEREATGILVRRSEVRSLHEDLVGPVRTPLLLLTIAAALVLVVASLNLALLLAARNLARETELGVRRAVGAGTGRLARLLLTEAGLIGVVGAAVGVAGSGWVVGVMDLGTQDGWSRLAASSARWGVVSTGAAAAVLVIVLLAALWPAVRAARSATLGARFKDPGKDLRRGISWVVGVESALVFSLLVAAGLTLVSLEAVTRVDPGFDAEGRVALDVRIPDVTYEGAEIPRFFETAARRLEALPGVTAAGAVTHLPLDPANWGGLFAIDGRADPAPDALPMIDWEFAGPGYFGAAGIPVLDGRVFTEDDGPDASLVAIINETLARRYWPDSSPVGARVNGNGFDGTWFTVVGVVGDVKQHGLEQPVRGSFYMSSLQSVYWPERQMIVHTATADAAATVPAIRRALLELEPRLTIGSVTLMEDVVHRASTAFRVRALVFGSLGLIAALLGMAGIYGVASYAVQARRREVGVRLAVGADRNRVFWMMVSDGFRPVLAGMLAGAGLAWVTGRWLQGFLFGIEPGNPVLMGAIAAMLGVAALAAILPSALRARRVDPVRMLRD